MPPSIDRSVRLISLALPGIAAFLLAQAVFTFGLWFTGFGEFSGPDPYMRLVRVLECQGGMACDGGLVTRSNVPFGEVLHWPFLLDRILLLLAAPFLLFTKFQNAVFVAGHLVGPLLGIGAMIALAAVARTIVSDSVARWAPVLASVHIWALYAFSPTRPDHHGVQALLFLLACLGALRILLIDGDRLGPWLAGFAVGMAVWVSTEGLGSTAPLLGTLAMIWVFRGGLTLTVGIFRLWCVGAAVLGLGLLLDGPQPDRWAAELDRFSVVHFTAFAVGAAFWSMLLIREAKTVRGRALVAVFGSGVAGALLVLLFPTLMGGPLAEMPQQLVPLFLDHVTEFLPAWRFGSRWSLMAVGTGVVGLFVAAGRAMRSKSAGASNEEHAVAFPGAGWVLVALALAWFSVLAFFGQVRWAHYVHVLAPVSLAALLVGAVRAVKASKLRPLPMAGANVALSLVFLTWPIVVLMIPNVGGSPPGPNDFCTASPMVSEVAELREEGERRLRVLSSLFWGPELILRGDVDVVAGPYFRNSAGILDSHSVMVASDPAEAREVLRGRGVDLVMLCVTEAWFPWVPADSAGTLYHDLVRDRPPSWLRPVPLVGAPDQYRLYEVVE